MKHNEAGYTLVELLVVMTVLAVLSLGTFTLFISLLHSAVISGRQAVASTLATNQMEYLKSLPYNNLAVTGGAIISPKTVPGTITKKINGQTYTIVTNITYVDDAYDGCGSYPTLALKQKYCRSYPPPAGAPATDSNPGDYRDVNVSVKDKSDVYLASVDSHVAALVAETASNTGALFVKVVDDSGTPVSGATITVTNSVVSPAVNASDTSDSNGIAIFYDLPPSTTNYRYQISAAHTGDSSLTTIVPSGTLTPTYSSQNLIAQSSSFVTLTLKPQAANSLVIETTDLNGSPLPNAKIYVKGGYKKYTATSDTTYYYDTLTPSDVRPTTDAGGLTALSNLVPGSYIFCGDAGATSCRVGATTYYLAAAIPYGGSNSLQPIAIPVNPDTPPATTYTYGGAEYLQKVRLMLTTSSTFPRVSTLSPDDVSLTGGTLANFAFIINGVNLPCSASAASCTTKVKFTQAANTYNASCTGNSGGLQLNCTVNLSSAVAGDLQMAVTVGSNTLTLPVSPLLGGLVATP